MTERCMEQRDVLLQWFMEISDGSGGEPAPVASSTLSEKEARNEIGYLRQLVDGGTSFPELFDPALVRAFLI